MSRYEAIKVLILKIHEYPIWKVSMAMCLEATDSEYLDMIYDGPHKPMKVAVSVAGEPEKMIDKDRKDYTPEDLSSIMKDAKDSNLKFLLALTEKWDFKVTSIRDNYQLDNTPLDEIYGVLKTHELEMEKRSKMKGSKFRSVALKVEEKPKEKARRKSYSKGKAMIANDHNNNNYMDQMATLLVESFKKKVYKKFKKGRIFLKKVPVPQTLIRGRTKEILIGRNQDLKNLTSQKRDVSTMMELDTLQLTAENLELRRNKL
ncbi:hypothetical protein AgCh_021100 [Apium graveolens]